MIQEQYDVNHASILELDLTNFANGMYQLMIKGEGQKIVTKKVLLMQTY